MEELEAMLPDDEPQSDLNRAESLIDGIPEGTSPAEVVRIAKQALALSEDCMGAWFDYGVYAENTATALERFEKGIEMGRVLFEKQIKASGEGHGLWDYIEIDSGVSRMPAIRSCHKRKARLGYPPGSRKARFFLNHLARVVFG